MLSLPEDIAQAKIKRVTGNDARAAPALEGVKG